MRCVNASLLLKETALLLTLSSMFMCLPFAQANIPAASPAITQIAAPNPAGTSSTQLSNTSGRRTNFVPAPSPITQPAAPAPSPITQTAAPNPAGTTSTNFGNPGGGPNFPGAGAGGDPHMKLYDGHRITYNGLCDVLLFQSPDAADGLSLIIQARLSQPNRQHNLYTYISEIAFAIGNEDVYEIQSEGATIIKNGAVYSRHFGPEHNFSTDATTNSTILPTSSSSTYSITKAVLNRHKVKYQFTFLSGSSISVLVQTNPVMCFIDLQGDFGGSKVEGLLGSPRTNGVHGRDGRRMQLTRKRYVNAYGQEWQVLENEPCLFLDVERYPQHPEKCVVVDLDKFPHDSGEELSIRGSRRGRRLALEEEENLDISLEEAKTACLGTKGTMKQFCIDDVIATGSVEIAEDSFYR